MLNLFLSLFRYKFTSIFSNTYFSIPYNPSLILLNLFPSLSQSHYTSIFFNLPFSISFYSTSINVNLFYLFVNLTSRLSFSMLHSLSHPMPYLSTWIFFYVLVFLNSRLSFLISPFLSHSILYLSSLIFSYLFCNINSHLFFQSPLFYLILFYKYQFQSFSIFLTI